MSRTTSFVVALATASFGFCITDASASGCVQKVVAQINFQPKKICWRYVGMANTFVGRFAAGQRITASAIGESYSSDTNTRSH